jgi:hypothetical protein
VVVVPVVAIFAIVALLVMGAGSLALLFFGWDVLLAVAVELAFSVTTARVAMGVERAGWLSAAVRLTWKPLLGALLCAVALAPPSTISCHRSIRCPKPYGSCAEATAACGGGHSAGVVGRACRAVLLARTGSADDREFIHDGALPVRKGCIDSPSGTAGSGHD